MFTKRHVQGCLEYAYQPNVYQKGKFSCTHIIECYAAIKINNCTHTCNMGTSHEHNMEYEKCDTKSTIYLIPLLQHREKYPTVLEANTAVILVGIGMRTERKQAEAPKMLVVLSLGLLLVTCRAHFEIHKIEFRIFVLFHMSTWITMTKKEIGMTSTSTFMAN